MRVRGVARDSFTLSSKVGRYMVPPRSDGFGKGGWAAPLELRSVFDYSYDGAMRSIEQSVIRLGFERIDILLLHDVDRWTFGAAFDRVFATAMEGAYRALAELRDAGHVAAIGVGVNEAAVAADFIRAGTFDCVMLAGRYTLLDQTALDELLPLALARGVEVFAAGVFNSGILAQSPPYARPMYNCAPASPEIESMMLRLTACLAAGVTSE